LKNTEREPARALADRSGKIELLAPAGSYDSCRAAVNAGADAIYMGGPLFNARAFAESSGEQDMLSDAIHYCHLRGVKVYMTLNILMKDREMEGLYDYVKPYADSGVDAVIVQDLGVLSFVRRHFPRLAVFASTQAFVTGPRYASFLKGLGVSRVVPARELTLEELKAIADAGVEVEAFGHGALCYAYSGQCLMSSFLGGRSGNRGRCAGSCRLPYQVLDSAGRPFGKNAGSYVLSMKDLHTLKLIPQLREAGVCSIKLEGRMKSPLYVAGVTAVYRKYLDLYERLLAEGRPGSYRVAEQDLRLLRELFDRGGFTEGYFTGKNGPDMVCLKEKPEMRVPDTSLTDPIRTAYVDRDSRIPVCGSAVLKAGSLPVLTLRSLHLSGKGLPESEITVSGDAPVLRAENRPLSREEFGDRLKKLGETPFEMKELSIDAEEGIFMPVGAVNALRRKAASMLEARLLQDAAARAGAGADAGDADAAAADGNAGRQDAGEGGRA